MDKQQIRLKVIIKRKKTERGSREECKWISVLYSIFFMEKKNTDDKLLKNDINVAGEDDAVVILAANGPGKFQGSKYPRN